MPLEYQTPNQNDTPPIGDKIPVSTCRIRDEESDLPGCSLLRLHLTGWFYAGSLPVYRAEPILMAADNRYCRTLHIIQA